jgi:hypothetical protein
MVKCRQSLWEISNIKFNEIPVRLSRVVSYEQLMTLIIIIIIIIIIQNKIKNSDIMYYRAKLLITFCFGNVF